MNLWFYSGGIQQYKTATSLVVFGTQTFKDAQIVKRIEELEIKLDKLEKEMHSSLEKNIIGFSNLISTESYTKYYNLNDELLKFITELNNKRNELHFLTGLTFNFSREMIVNLKKIDNFGQETVNRYITGNLNKKHEITTAMMIFWLLPKTSHSLGRYGQP